MGLLEYKSRNICVQNLYIHGQLGRGEGKREKRGRQREKRGKERERRGRQKER